MQWLALVAIAVYSSDGVVPWVDDAMGGLCEAGLLLVAALQVGRVGGVHRIGTTAIYII